MVGKKVILYLRPQKITKEEILIYSAGWSSW